MSEVKNEFDYVLKTPFPYALKGQQEEASFIRLQAPTTRHTKECAALDQAMSRAIQDTFKDRETEKSQPTESEPESENTLTGLQVMSLLSSSPVVDLGDVVETAIRLFTSGGQNPIATVDGETRLTKNLAELMRHSDMSEMTGEYLVNFTPALASDPTKQNS